jgi:hypothetical protein
VRWSYALGVRCPTYFMLFPFLLSPIARLLASTNEMSTQARK